MFGIRLFIQVKTLTRGLYLLPLVAVTALANAQTTFTVTDKSGKVVGMASLDYRMDSAGRFTASATISRNDGISIKDKSVYSSNGSPMSDSALIGQSGQSATVNATFGRNAVSITAEFNGQKKTRTLPYPKGANLRDTSTFWFIRDHPRIGTTISYTSFDLSTLKFSVKAATYAGDETINFHGHSVWAHVLRNTDNTQYVDDRSMPYTMKTSEGLLFTRT